MSLVDKVSQGLPRPLLIRKMPQNQGFCVDEMDGTTPGQRERRAPSALVMLAPKPAILPQQQLWHPFTGLQYYHTSRRRLSPIFHVCTGEKARQGEALHLLV